MFLKLTHFFQTACEFNFDKKNNLVEKRLVTTTCSKIDKRCILAIAVIISVKL